VALSSVAGGELLIALAVGDRAAPWQDSLRFIAAAATFCPLVALLGGKRPQDRAWQWIVLSFLVILALPAAQFLLLSPGQPMSMHAVWSWFLVVLVFVQLSNHLPTRFAPAVILLVAGQTALLWRYLPWVSASHTALWVPLAGQYLILVGLLVGAIVWS